jgi:hypothetical protein
MKEPTMEQIFLAKIDWVFIAFDSDTYRKQEMALK